MITAKEIEKNWNRHKKIIDVYLSEERKQKVLTMLESLGEHYIMSPASTKDLFHNAFLGGYIDHVNRVVQLALLQKVQYSDLGGKIDFTDEELVFSALFHDLGKIGEPGKPIYLPQDDKWRQDKLKEKFKINPELDFLTVPDRSLYTLQKYGIEVNLKEYLAIKCHDGLYEEANKPYFLSNNVDSKLRTNLVYIVHTADFLAAKIEYDLYSFKH